MTPDEVKLNESQWCVEFTIELPWLDQNSNTRDWFSVSEKLSYRWGKNRRFPHIVGEDDTRGFDGDGVIRFKFWTRGERFTDTMLKRLKRWLQRTIVSIERDTRA